MKDLAIDILKMTLEPNVPSSVADDMVRIAIKLLELDDE